MHRVKALSDLHLPRSAAALLALAAGLGTAGLIGVAVAKTFTLQVAKNATVMPQGGSARHETIVVNGRGMAVYELSGDSQTHPECTITNKCEMFWPPVKVASSRSLSKPKGVPGKLGVWHHDGISQVTDGGHPLYTFSGDSKRHTATGEGITSFGGTWHVLKAKGSGGAGGGSGSSSSGSTGSTGSTGTTTTTGCAYPPCGVPY